MINTKEKIGIALAMSMGVLYVLVLFDAAVMGRVDERENSACFAAIIKAYEIMPMATASGDYLVSCEPSFTFRSSPISSRC